jgi:uncharacterized protein (TIGR00297 family)
MPQEIQVASFLWGAAINAMLALGAWRAKTVTAGGAITGWVLGTWLYGFAGWRGFLMLGLFFVLGTVATRMGYGKKAALGIAQEKGGRRGPSHALANAGAGAAFAALAATTPYGPALTLAMVAAFATAASDTVASEIGQAYGRRHVMITTFRSVEPGTEGAVSIEGTLAGAAAAAVVAATAWAIGLVPPAGIAWVVIAAFVATSLESYAGAFGFGRTRVANEIANFGNTVVGGGVAVGLAWIV